MKNIYDKIDEEFFKRHQRILLWFVNTYFGRRYWRIRSGKGRIHQILPNCISYNLRYEFRHGQWYKIQTTEFRTASGYANRLRWSLRYAWPFILAIGSLFSRYAFRIPALDTIFLFSVIPSTVTTVYPDPNPETTSVDGTVYRFGVDETFGTIRGGAGNGFNDSAVQDSVAAVRTSTTTDQFSRLLRGIYLFDTSSIPDGDTINSATISFYGQAAASNIPLNATDRILHVVASTPASDTALANADYGNLGTTSFGSFDPGASFANWSTTGYNDITLNASGLAAISKTGISKFGTRFECDRANSFTTTWSSDQPDSLDNYMADQAGTANDPKLVVTHSTPVENNEIFKKSTRFPVNFIPEIIIAPY